MNIDIEKLVEESERRNLPLNTLTKVFGNANLAALIRRKILERRLSISLSSVGSTILDFEELEGRIVVNSIGGIQLPIAVAGPTRIEGSFLHGDIYIPIATTTKSAVQALEIGSRASNAVGGIEAQCIRKEMELRVALPRSACIDRVLNELRRIESNKIRAIHLELTEHETVIVFELSEFVDDSEILSHVLLLLEERGCRTTPLRIQYVGISSSAKIMLVDRAVDAIGVDLPELTEFITMFKRFRERALDCLARTIGGVAIALGQPFENIVKLYNSKLVVDSKDNALLLRLSLKNLVLNTRSGGALLPMQREALELARINEPNSIQKLAELLAAVGILGLVGYAVLQIQGKSCSRNVSENLV